MKLSDILATALCVHAGLAIPHGLHNRRHIHKHKRAAAVEYSVVTDIVTVTDYGAVVWVDQNGKIVTTEFKTLPTSSASSPSMMAEATVTAGTETLTLSTPVPSSSISPASATNSATVQQGSSVIVSAPSSSAGSPAGIVSRSSASHHNKVSVTTGTNENAAAAPAANPVNTASTAASAGAGSIAGFGVAYDPFTTSGCRPSIDSDFAFLAGKGANMIRVYDGCFAQAVAAAAAHGLKLMIGLTSFNNFNTNLGTLISDVTSQQASWSVVDTVFIGNELVNSKQASSATVAAQVSSARGTLKGKGFNGNVVTVDTFVAMAADPTICSTSDYCAANAHAFFDGNVLPAGAGKFVRNAQSAVAATSGGKRVVITESGWPHAGAPNGKAIPSVENQRTAMASIVAEFASDPGDMFLFEAYDAKYKVNQPEIERNFGIFDADHYNGIP